MAKPWTPIAKNVIRKKAVSRTANLPVVRTFIDVLRCSASSPCCLVGFRSGRPLLSRLLDSFSLRPHQLLDSAAPELQQFVHLCAREWLSFGRALDFDKAAIAGADDVHVHFGARILLIFQIKQRRSVNDPDADGGDLGDDWRPLDSL